MTRLLVCRKDCVAHKRIKNTIWRNMQNVSPSLLHSVFSFQTRLEEFWAVNELWFSSLHLLAFVFALPVFYTFRLCFLSLFICHTNTICSLNGRTISMFPSSSEPTFPSSHVRWFRHTRGFIFSHRAWKLYFRRNPCVSFAPQLHRRSLSSPGRAIIFNNWLNFSLTRRDVQ